MRVKGSIQSIKQLYSLTSTAYSKDGNGIIVGGIDNNIYVNLLFYFS